jgi:hypothetical protein
MDFEKCIVCVGLTRKQRLDFPALNFSPKSSECGFGFGNDLLIVLLLPKRDKADGFVQAAFQLGVGCQRRVEVLALAHELLGALGVIPERRILRYCVEIAKTSLSFVPVKDTSGEERGIA